MFKKLEWGIYDCVTGAFGIIDSFPFGIGCGDFVDLDLGTGPEGSHVFLDSTSGGAISLTKQFKEVDLFVDGKAVNYEELKPGEDHSIMLNGRFLALRAEKKIEKWHKGLNHESWILYDSMTQSKDGPMPLVELCRVAKEKDRHPQSSVLPVGLTMGFYLQQILAAGCDQAPAAEVAPVIRQDGEDVYVDPFGVIEPIVISGPVAAAAAPPEVYAGAAQAVEEPASVTSAPEPPPLPDEAPEPTPAPVATPAPAPPEPEPVIASAPPEPVQRILPDAGSLTCPVCWLHFDEGDIMHVAMHNSLRGDPILGEDALQRFYPTRFNDRGQALDAFGLACIDMACPHCRRKLPPGFVGMPQHIFSIVGDQSAGKSYFLSVLMKVLPNALSRHFQVNFQDADPEGNAILNDMKNALFAARKPEDARLLKTQLDGAMYERLPRYGRTVALPKPFIFSLGSGREGERPYSVVFYDNAGEHFQPGRDSADSPGAQHVAHSSGILFLFDPFNSPEFRERIAGQPDPQFEQPIMDQQDVILSEMRVRIQKLLALAPGERIDVPLAVMMGKCDAWMSLLGDEPFEPVIKDGKLNLAAIDRNSDKCRDLLADICPRIVSNAESISRNVRYFPVSAFGHPPVRIDSGTYVPDPGQLKPILLDAPVLWQLARVTPELVPTTND